MVRLFYPMLWITQVGTSNYTSNENSTTLSFINVCVTTFILGFHAVGMLNDFDKRFVIVGNKNLGFFVVLFSSHVGHSSICSSGKMSESLHWGSA